MCSLNNYYVIDHYRSEIVPHLGRCEQQKCSRLTLRLSEAVHHRHPQIYVGVCVCLWVFDAVIIKLWELSSWTKVSVLEQRTRQKKNLFHSISRWQKRDQAELPRNRRHFKLYSHRNILSYKGRKEKLTLVSIWSSSLNKIARRRNRTTVEARVWSCGLHITSKML